MAVWCRAAIIKVFYDIIDIKQVDLVIAVDITGLKEAEEALRKAHERMAMILGSIDDGFFSLDREFRVTYVNERGANILGRPLEMMTGRSLWTIFPEAVGSDFERAYQTAMTQRVTAAAESFYAPLNAWFEAYAYPSEDGISVFFRDISDRKRTEQVLRESQADLSWAQAVGQVGSWRLNVRRNELLWSDENYRIFGVPKGTALSYETFLSTVHPEDREYVNRKWTAALHGEPYDIEHRIVVGDIVKDGFVVHCRLRDRWPEGYRMNENAGTDAVNAMDRGPW